METDLLKEQELSPGNRLGRKVGNRLFPNVDPPLLSDQALGSVVHMLVRQNECDQAIEGGKAVRHWYEQSLHQERLITRVHQQDVLFLLRVIKQMASTHGVQVPVEHMPERLLELIDSLKQG